MKKDDWIWIGMQGDNTDSIITNEKADNFNSIVTSKLSSGNTVSSAFATTLNVVGGSFMKGDRSLSIMPLVFAGECTGLVVL